MQAWAKTWAKQLLLFTRQFASRRFVCVGMAFLSMINLAYAGEIRFFEHADFQGRQICLRNDEPSLRRYDFNDKVSSVVIRSGRWQICTDDDFHGACVVVEPGDYPRLDWQWNDRISSVRELDSGRRESWDHWGRDHERDRGERQYDRSYDPRDDRGYRNDRGHYQERYQNRDQDRYQQYDQNRRHDYNSPATVFADSNFQGRSAALYGDTLNLDQLGLNDEISSIDIREGVWQLCTDGNFRGRCRVLTPGRYNNVGDLNDQISSIRRLR